MRELSDLVESAGVKLESSRVRLVLDTSSVVPDLTYLWALYAPRERLDASFAAVAAVYSDRGYVLGPGSDWTELLSEVGWFPAKEAEALSLCSEILRTTGARADPIRSPRIYSGKGSLDGVDLGPSARAEVEALEGPSVTYADSTHSWSSTFWAVELRQTTLYTCNLAPNRVTIRAVDSIPGLGFVGIGP